MLNDEVQLSVKHGFITSDIVGDRSSLTHDDDPDEEYNH